MVVIECIIALIVALCVCVFGYCNKAFRYFENRGVKHLKPVMVFGNVIETTLRRKHVFYQMDDFYKSFPDERVVGIYEFFSPVFMIRDPDLVKQVLVKDFDHFVDHRTMFEKDHDEVFGSNLAALKGEQWRLMRSTLSPAFTGSKMRHMCPFVVKCAEQVVWYLRSECDRKQKEGGRAELDMELKDLYARFANDVIASTAFGYEINSHQDRENRFFKTGKLMFTFGGFQMLKFYLILTFPKLCKLLRMSIFSSKGTKFFKDIFLSTVKHRQDHKIVRKDMINILMEAQKGTLKHESQGGSDHAGFAAVEESDIGKKQHGNHSWTINELAAQTFIFFFAGFETVSSVLCFATHELVANQQVQEKLWEEIDASFSKYGALSYETIQNMTYLDMVISEALRLWSPAPVLDRMCVKPYRVPDKDGNKTALLIEKGTTIYIPARGLGRDPKYWEDPEKFDPERFLPENKHKINPFTYLPFGSGPRNCIGSRYALMEVKILLCYLLKNFELRRNDKTSNVLVFPPNTFSMTVKGGFWLKFVPRNWKLSS